MIEYTPFGMSFRRFASLPSSQKHKLELKYLRSNSGWISEKFNELGADWILVLGTSGKIYSCSNNPDTYPSTEELKRIAESTEEVPYVLSRPPLIEEIKTKEIRTRKNKLEEVLV